MALNLNGSKPVEKQQEEKVVEKTTATPEVGTEKPTFDESVCGTASKDLAFVMPLGNPAKKDTTSKTLDDGTKGKIETPALCGYRFKLLKDMLIPDCGTDDRLANDLMNFTKVDWVQKKAGEEVDLTFFETAALLSQPQFNGYCLGGEIQVGCVYKLDATVTKGGVEKVSGSTSAPRVSLRPLQQGSIKDNGIIPVLEVERKVRENGTVRMIKTIIPGFEKWAPLAKNATPKTGASKARGDKAQGTAFNPKAAAFMAFVQSQQRKQKNAK